ncbi:MAG TPA: nucleotidyltransferase family protein [Terriglobia bacterium]|nr:nucleotidyltransferase family protein [Terriglobia bacterium]
MASTPPAAPVAHNGLTSLPPLPPEDRLCLLLARGRLSADDEQQARELLAQPLNWDALLDRARVHEIVPMLYHHLARLVAIDLPAPGGPLSSVAAVTPLEPAASVGLPGDAATVAPAAVPAAVMSQLEEAYRISRLRTALLAEELARLLLLLNEDGVPVIPLKGVPLAQALYGDAALRYSIDIDLLIPASDAVRARRLLLSHGFESTVPEAFFLAHQFPSCAECTLMRSSLQAGTPATIPARAARNTAGGDARGTQNASLKAGATSRSGFPVDLRWGLLPYWRGDAAAIRDLWDDSRDAEAVGDFWDELRDADSSPGRDLRDQSRGAQVVRDLRHDLGDESRNASLSGVQARRLSPEWEFLYLALHAASHGWQMLKSLADIHQIATTQALDWAKVREKARRFGLESAVEQTLTACALLLGTPPPPGFAPGDAPQPLSAGASPQPLPATFVLRPLPAGVRLFPATPTSGGSWAATRLQLFPLERRSGRLRMLAAFLFVPSPAEYEWLPLPAWLGFLYYPLRPLRLAFKWTATLLAGM